MKGARRGPPRAQLSDPAWRKVAEAEAALAALLEGEELDMLAFAKAYAAFAEATAAAVAASGQTSLRFEAVKKFIEVSNQHGPYLLRKAQRIEDYLNQR